MTSVNLRKEPSTPSARSSIPNRSVLDTRVGATRSRVRPAGMTEAAPSEDTVDVIIWSAVLALAMAGWAFAIWLAAILLKDGALFPWSG
jgi:hypothetical protein